MDNVKDDKYYRAKMRDDLIFIKGHMDHVSREEFNKEEILQDSMMFRLIQVSENAKKLTEDYKEKQHGVPWPDIYGLRNRIVHEYGHVDLGIVYDTLIYDVPDLLEKI